jgi:hypothetical protein
MLQVPGATAYFGAVGTDAYGETLGVAYLAFILKRFTDSNVDYNLKYHREVRK